MAHTVEATSWGYRYLLDNGDVVEVGDSTVADFKAVVKTSRGPAWFKVGWNAGTYTPSLNGLITSFSFNSNINVSVYPVDADERADTPRMEYDVQFLSRPAGNPDVTLEIDWSGITWRKILPLDVEYPDTASCTARWPEFDTFVRTPTSITGREIATGETHTLATRKEWEVNSYEGTAIAPTIQSTQMGVNKNNGQPINYVRPTRTHLHIHRGKMTDNNGQTAWVEDININETAKTITFTLPRSWLRNAAYPVRQVCGVDPAYTQKMDNWLSTAWGGSDGVWGDYDIFTNKGVPKGAVAEIILSNATANTENTLGLRTDGSSLARYVTLHEAEGGGETHCRMFVTVHATTGLIECYHSDVSDADAFYLVGYWTNVGFTETWSNWNGITSGWQDVTSCGANVVEHSILHTRSLYQDESVLIGVRTKGSTLARYIQLHEAEAGGESLLDMFVKGDGSSLVQYYISSNAGAIYTAGYFDSSMDFVELWQNIAVTSTGWQSYDLTAYLDQDGRMADFLLAHHVAATAGVTMGARDGDDSTTNRYLVEHEAEWTGSDTTEYTGFSMSAKTNATGVVKLYSTEVTEEGFYLTGYFKPAVTSQSVTVSYLSIASSVVSPSLAGTGSAGVTLSYMSIAATVVSPVVSTPQPQTIEISPVSVAASVISPTLAGTGSASITIEPMSVAASVITPTVAPTGSAPVVVEPMSVVTSVQSPSLSATGSASIQLSAVSVTTSVQSPVLSGTGTATILLSSILHEAYNDTGKMDGSSGIYDVYHVGMTFHVTESHYMSRLRFYFTNSGNGAVTTAKIFNLNQTTHLPVGDSLATCVIPADAVTGGSYAWIDVVLSNPVWVEVGTEYGAVCSAPAGDESNQLAWCVNKIDGDYATGGELYSTNGGVSFTFTDGWDYLFEEYEEAPIITVVSVQSPSVSGSGSASVSVGSISVATSVVTPTLAPSGSAPIVLSYIQITTSVVSPSVAGTGSAIITVQPVAVVSSVQSPTVAGTGSVPISIGYIQTVTSVQSPSLAGTGSSSVVVSYIQVASSIVSPVLAGTGSASISVSYMSVSVSVVSPTVSTSGGPQEITIDPVSVATAVVSPSLAGSGSATITVQPISVNTTVVSPTLVGTGSAPITLAPVSVATSVQSPSIAGTGSAPITIGSVSVASTVVSPTVAGTSSAPIVLAPLASTVTVQSPSVAGTGTAGITISYMAVVTSVVDPTVSASGQAVIDIDPVSVSVSVQSPTVSATGSATISISYMQVADTVVSPSIAGTGTATVTVSYLSVTTSVVSPTVSAGAAPQSVEIDPVSMAASVVSPTVSGTGTATVVMSILSVASSVQTPTLAGSGTASIVSSPLTITASVVSPTLSQGVAPQYITISPVSVAASAVSPVVSGTGTASIQASYIQIVTSVQSPVVSAGTAIIELAPITVSVTVNDPHSLRHTVYADYTVTLPNRTSTVTLPLRDHIINMPERSFTLTIGGTTMSIQVPRGDFGFYLNFTVKNYDTSPKDLSGYTIKVLGWGPRSKKFLDGTGAIVVAGSGTCRYEVQEGDFQTAGVFPGEIQLEQSGVRESSLPIEWEVLQSP